MKVVGSTVGAAIMAALLVTVSVPLAPAPHAAAQGCPMGGLAPGVVYVVFAPGTPTSERATAHAAAGAMPGEASPGEASPFPDGSIAVTVIVPVGSEDALLTAYRARPSVQTARRVFISPPVCPVPRVDAVSLVAGCNNVAASWPDGTPAAAVAAAVQPEHAVSAVWRLDAARGRVDGFSPQAPEVSDLTSVNRPDALFICMREPGTLTRPII